MRKHAAISSILTLIGAIIFLGLAILLFTTGMISPIRFTFNGYHESAYLYEYTQYPRQLSGYVILIILFLILGAVGIFFSIRVKKKATTLQGVILIIAGIFTLLSMGGIFYLIGGIQTLLARNQNKEIPTTIM